MQYNILWSGIEYYSLEHCIVNQTAHGIRAESTILGFYKDNIYRVDYTIDTDTGWQTNSVKVQFRDADELKSIHLQRDDNNNWLQDGNSMPHWKDCVDVDLPLTPFTNSLPINRLGLNIDETQTIRVIYLDLLAGSVRVVKQRYTRTSASRYHYENVPNDFEADIEVDVQGLVIHYPGLFLRKAIKALPY